jgi:hypothetical protein
MIFIILNINNLIYIELIFILSLFIGVIIYFNTKIKDLNQQIVTLTETNIILNNHLNNFASNLFALNINITTDIDFDAIKKIMETDNKL